VNLTAALMPPLYMNKRVQRGRLSLVSEKASTNSKMDLRIISFGTVLNNLDNIKSVLIKIIFSK
jgi:hypothetical protein